MDGLMVLKIFGPERFPGVPGVSGVVPNIGEGGDGGIGDGILTAGLLLIILAVLYFAFAVLIGLLLEKIFGIYDYQGKKSFALAVVPSGFFLWFEGNELWRWLYLLIH